jgi:hypothetical protein
MAGSVEKETILAEKAADLFCGWEAVGLERS